MHTFSYVFHVGSTNGMVDNCGWRKKNDTRGATCPVPRYGAEFSWIDNIANGNDKPWMVWCDVDMISCFNIVMYFFLIMCKSMNGFVCY